MKEFVGTFCNVSEFTITNYIIRDFFKTIFRNIQESWDMQDEKQKQQQLLSISDASHSNLKCIFQLE